MRPDRQPCRGDRLLQIPAPRARGRCGAAHRHSSSPASVLAHLNAELRPQKLFFPVDPSTHARCTHRRHGRQQFVRVEVDPLRADGRQRAGHRRDPGGRDAASVRRGTGRHEFAAHRRAHAAPARAGRRGGGRDQRRNSPACCAASAATIWMRWLPGTARKPGAAAGRVRGHAGVLRRAGTEAVPDQARKVLGICQFPTFRRGDAAPRKRWSRSTRRRSSWSTAR